MKKLLLPFIIVLFISCDLDSRRTGVFQNMYTIQDTVYLETWTWYKGEIIDYRPVSFRSIDADSSKKLVQRGERMIEKAKSITIKE